jgi:hypothetical protein
MKGQKRVDQKKEHSNQRAKIESNKPIQPKKENHQRPPNKACLRLGMHPINLADFPWMG